MSAVELDAIKALWLKPCGPCDYGMPASCTCPEGDPRLAIKALVELAEKQGNELDTVHAELLQARAMRDERTAELVTANGAVEATRRLCNDYTPEPPPLFRGPGLSEHGVGYNAGTRDMAQAVLGTLDTALNLGSGDGE